MSARTVPNTSCTRSAPSFTFSTGKSAASRTFTASVSGTSMPMDMDVTGCRVGSTPSIRYSGTPITLPAQSCSARSTAAFAAGLSGSAASTASDTSRKWRRSRPSSTGASFWSAASTVSHDSP